MIMMRGSCEDECVDWQWVCKGTKTIRINLNNSIEDLYVTRRIFLLECVKDILVCRSSVASSLRMKLYPRRIEYWQRGDCRGFDGIQLWIVWIINLLSSHPFRDHLGNSQFYCCRKAFSRGFFCLERTSDARRSFFTKGVGNISLSRVVK